ncbi:hypothetical protein CC78DRAFT_527985 [Lojkania enalia]|uniref:Septin-type G domain-containing protein n=1 Tax=Lojkania enalia TaxID=147567 RepID=A0A9P4NDB4_9PLEO|nr:hypothetical protein CC78DRAFT_527985 [Didymosphaeria enalia]
MWPSSDGDLLPSAKPRSRKSSADHSAAHHGPSSHVPTTFFLRSESEMEQSLADSQAVSRESKQRESTFGVQSLADTLETAFGQETRRADKMPVDVVPASNRQGNTETTSQASPRCSNRPSENSKSQPLRKQKKASNPGTSAPPTPLIMDATSPIPPSVVPSTPKSVSLHSLKLSDEESGLDEVTSQALISSGEEEDENTEQSTSESFPQLVMPSIQMPTRRPFTSRGKAMGKLKVLVAGEVGVGKTSLIRSIVQLCEDIVHVDPLSLSQSFPQATQPKPNSRKQKGGNPGTTRITEIHASTKSYPHWWTDIEENRVLRRRKSSSDSILERNLCFIDTPGYGKCASTAEDISLVVDYVESLMYQTSSIAYMEDNELLGVIGGNGGVLVDLVMYLLPPSHDISKDVEYMQRLSALTNVIPIIAKSDTLSPSDIVAIKTSILARLQTTSIKPFLFGNALDDALLAVQGLPITTSPSIPFPWSDSGATAPEFHQYPFHIPTHPYAVSSTAGPDVDTMDASLLMSPDYVQPLYPSELATLVNLVFDADSIAWLRHSAAKKFLAWRHRTKFPGDSFTLHDLVQQSRQRGSVSSSSVGLHRAPLNASGSSSIFSAASPSGVLVPRITSPFYLSNSQYNSNLQSPFQGTSPSLSHSQPEGLDGPPEFSLARYNNSHNQGEQRMAEVRLAKWATDLQRSLRNERDRFEELQRSERAKWLLERVGEEVREGNIIPSPAGSHRADWAIVRHNKSSKEMSGVGQRYGKAKRLDSRDPLGLCDFSDEMRRRGFVVVKVLGGMSVLGAVVVAVVRACGVESALPEGGLWSWIAGGGGE